jgi:pyruvate formate lyase activating enzyme
MVGREVAADEVMEEVLRDRVFFRGSGGGVTFSGGEPLAQPGFLRALLSLARGHGIHTAVDTCGFAPRETLLGLVPLVDLFLFDVKLLDDGRHRELTGLPTEPILANLRALTRAHGDVWIRVPVVPGHTDDENDVAAIAALAVELPGVRQVSLLPFHATGGAKARRLGRDTPLEAIVPPAPERMESLADLFRERGLTVSIGG